MSVVRGLLIIPNVNLGQAITWENFSPYCHNGNSHNGNRTEWSPIRSVIIQVINKIGRPHSGSPICLITSMITDRIGWHEVLLPINHIYNKILESDWLSPAMIWALIGQLDVISNRQLLVISNRPRATRSAEYLWHDVSCGHAYVFTMCIFPI